MTGKSAVKTSSPRLVKEYRVRYLSVFNGVLSETFTKRKDALARALELMSTCEGRNVRVHVRTMTCGPWEDAR